MIAAFAAIVMQSAGMPEKPMVGYSGIPDVASPNLVLQSHNVTILIGKDFADVSSVTLYKNTGPAGPATIMIGQGSLGGGSLPSGITATWANAPLALVPSMRSDQLAGPPPLHAAATVQNLGSYALRVKYRVAVGRSGFDHKQRLVAYDLASRLPIGTLMVTYSYAPGVVFHLPEAGPGSSWQIGPRGAFLKALNYDGRGALSYCAFYPAGFGGR